ncbi:alpha/beta fold hydrolase [Xylophilus sp.]|uniref:alpha/beta fold hydrolase n=1 Tax=Xylophilus sp. TaxID=2653893 RepID=UPI002D807CE7|nr:alpha/beta fold hydrolase [Xylophilus sp.]
MPGSAAVADACARIARIDAVAARHIVRHDGCAVHWRIWGTGAPLVLLHGGHGSWVHWIANVEVLAARRQVIAPDMPGFGDSDNLSLLPHDAGRADALLAQLEAGLDALLPGGVPFDLAAFSFGGAIAGRLAARLPRVRQLLLLGSGGHGARRRQTAPLVDWRLPDPQARREALSRNLGAFMLANYRGDDALALEVHERSCLATRFRSKAISQAGQLPQVLADFGRPIRMAWGGHDVTAEPHEAAALLGAGQPGRTLDVVPDAGHWVQYERAEAVNELLLRWLGV